VINKKSIVKLVIVLAVLIFPAMTFACDAAGPSTHIGQVMSIDEKKMTFTIRDAQTRKPIMFIASNSEIISGLKSANGMITVNYEDEDGDLMAVGVTF